MRLIDADALKEQIESHVVSMSVCLSMDEHYGKVTMREDCLQDIADAHTIDAIPVEWLEEQADYTRSAWDYDTCEGIRVVLKAWQEEQEANDA